MNFSELIKNRQSIRNYDPDKIVSENILTEILNAGRLAPSAANNQPWKFFIISSLEMLEKVRPCYDRDWFKNAPHILIVTGDRTKAWNRQDGYNSLETDLAIAMNHLILAAEEKCIATCWVANFKLDVLKSALSLSENETVFAISPLGYPRESFQKNANKDRKPLDKIAKLI